MRYEELMEYTAIAQSATPVHPPVPQPGEEGLELAEIEADRNIILLIYEDRGRAKEVISALEKNLEELEIGGIFEPVVKKFKDTSSAMEEILQIRPLFIVIQNNIKNNPDFGFQLAEAIHPRITEQIPLYTIIHGPKMDEPRKERSRQIHLQDPFHLGTCSIDIDNDDLLVTKVVGVLAQLEEYIAFHHLESSRMENVRETLQAMIKPLIPLKKAMGEFNVGKDKAFMGVERFLLNMEYELKKLRTYYNKLFNMEINGQRIGYSQEPVGEGKNRKPLLTVFVEIGQFLTDTRSPLVRLATWMKSIDFSSRDGFAIQTYLENTIGDYNIIGYCKVFMTRFDEFEQNLRLVEEYVSERM